eukprot:XP_011665733.1 PREDICTED: uncharacterized protein LOC105438986 [Strongylocentrotus purpuratus]
MYGDVERDSHLKKPKPKSNPKSDKKFSRYVRWVKNIRRFERILKPNIGAGLEDSMLRSTHGALVQGRDIVELHQSNDDAAAAKGGEVGRSALSNYDVLHLFILQIEIDIEPMDKVERIKERVEEKEGIPPAQQRLIFSGKQMNDDKTASDYKVNGGSVLHLVLALRGGNR